MTLRSLLELARIGSLLFVLVDSPHDQIGSSSPIDTFATRLSAQPLTSEGLQFGDPGCFGPPCPLLHHLGARPGGLSDAGADDQAAPIFGLASGALTRSRRARSRSSLNFSSSSSGRSNQSRI